MNVLFVTACIKILSKVGLTHLKQASMFRPLDRHRREEQQKTVVNRSLRMCFVK